MAANVDPSMIRTPSVPALDRGLAIIELLSESPKGLTLPQVARKLKIPKSSAHCLLVTLERSGYLTRPAVANRYRLGFKLLGLASAALVHVELRERARPHLRELAGRTSLTVHVAVLEKNEAVIIEKVEAPHTQRLATWPGKRMDVHCTALGKVLLSDIDEPTLRKIVREHGLPRHNENTIASPRRLLAEMETVRERGFAMEDEEDEIGCRCLGAGIRDETGRVVAAVSLSGTINEVHAGNATQLAAMLLQTVSRISEDLKSAPEAIQQIG